MKRLLSPLLLAFCTGAAQAAPESTDSVALTLVSISTIYSEGDPVNLIGQDGQRCTYNGHLVRLGRIETFMEKLAARAGGSQYRWTINITQQTCPNNVPRPVALLAPLANVPGFYSYKAGDTLMALPSKSEKQ